MAAIFTKEAVEMTGSKGADMFEIKEVIALDNPVDLSPLEVFALPVSGGGFVAQVGLLSELYMAKWVANGRRLQGSKSYQPDLVLGSSGGNVAAYIAMAGDWCPEGMLRMAAKMETKMFIQSWFPDFMSFIPTWLIGATKGSIYREGYGAKDLFKNIFSCESIQKTEVWIGAYDLNYRRAQFFCNLQQARSMISADYINESTYFYGTLPVRYLDGDPERIAKACMASASIPLLVSKQSLDGNGYADGGIMYASPLTVFRDEVYRLVMGNNPYHERLEREARAGGSTATSFTVDPRSQTAEVKEVPGITHAGSKGLRALHLIYFCSYEMDVAKGVRPEHRQSTPNVAETLQQLLDASVLQDRAAAVDLLHRCCGDEAGSIVFTHHPHLNHIKLAEILTELNQQRHYVIILYPHGNPTVRLQNFKAFDIQEQVANTRAAYGGYIWYFPTMKGSKGDSRPAASSITGSSRLSREVPAPWSLQCRDSNGRDSHSRAVGSVERVT